jgi:hypothetical protein
VCLNTVGGVPTPVGHTPATGSAAPRQWRAGVNGGQGRRRSDVYQNRYDHLRQQPAAREPPRSRG